MELHYTFLTKFITLGINYLTIHKTRFISYRRYLPLQLLTNTLSLFTCRVKYYTIWTLFNIRQRNLINFKQVGIPKKYAVGYGGGNLTHTVISHHRVRTCRRAISGKIKCLFYFVKEICSSIHRVLFIFLSRK